MRGVHPRIDETPGGGRRETADAASQAYSHADDHARKRGRVEALVALLLASEVDLGVGHGAGLAGDPQSPDHHATGQQQQPRAGRHLAGQRAHRRRQRFGRGLSSLVGMQAGHRDADEVDQVVGRERHRQRERADQDDRLEDVDPAQQDDVKDHRRGGEDHSHQQPRVALDPVARFGRDESGAFGSFDQDEVGDRGHRDPRPQRAVALHLVEVVEREDQARQELDDRAANEGNGHRQQDAHDDRQRLAGVDVLAQIAKARARAENLE